MRVLITSHHAAPVGGVETYIDTIVPALVAAGHDIGVWHEEGSHVTAAAADVPRWFRRAGPDSIARVSLWRPDLVFTHGLRDHALEIQVTSLAPAITFAHSYLGTCVSGNKMHAFPAAVPCTRRFGPPCLALYYPRRCGGLNPLTALAMYSRQAQRLRLLDRYRRILVGSRYMADEYGRHGLASKTTVVSMPAASAETPPTTKRAGPWRLLYLGRLEWNKGADIAIDAAARAAMLLGAPVRLTVAGRGSMQSRLCERATSLGSEDPRVTYDVRGPVTPDERADILRRTDLLLVPSRWPEPFGLVGNEAGAQRVPAIAFATGGIVDWLTDGVEGRLVSGTPNVESFARGIASLLDDPTRLVGMGEASRQRALRYSVAHHVEELDAIFRAAVEPAAGCG